MYEKKYVFFCGALCLLLVFIYTIATSQQNDSVLKKNINQEVQTEEIIPKDVSDKTLSDESPSEKETVLADNEKPAYIKAYTEFLLHADIDPEPGFPIRGYYVFDLNFDQIPELGVLHDSWGSMGGYFTYYYFDGNEVTAVLNDNGEPARSSNYTQMLADSEQKKVYLLKEMYLLQGNENGTYGYVREIKSKGQAPCVYPILNLEVDQGSDLMSHMDAQYACEDEFLSDSDLEDCLITQRYTENEWITISSAAYLNQKRELIPEENHFVDLLEGASHYLGANYDDDGALSYTDVRMEKEEIEQLFRNFTQ